jgi:hypothetical protein
MLTGFEHVRRGDAVQLRLRVRWLQLLRRLLPAHLHEEPLAVSDRQDMRRRGAHVLVIRRSKHAAYLVALFATAVAASACFSTHCIDAPFCAPHPGSGDYEPPREETPAEREAYQRSAAKERRPRRRRAFAAGATCSCMDQACGVAPQAERFCGSRGRDCVDEILMNATQGGGVQLLPGSPRVLLRVGAVVGADGVVRKVELDRVPVALDDDDAETLTPIGPNAGQSGHTGPFEVKDATSLSEDIAIDGVDYTCDEETRAE